MSKWDGQPIGYTSECSGCNFYQRIAVLDENVEVCAWGVAFKFLYMPDKIKKCNKIRAERQPTIRSLERINRNSGIIRKKWLEKKGEKTIQLELF